MVVGDEVNIRAIEEEIEQQREALPRGDLALKALGHSFTVFARDMVEVWLFLFPSSTCSCIHLTSFCTNLS